MRTLLNRRKLIAGSGGKYIKFKDPEVERICVANFSSDGIGVTKEDAEAVTSWPESAYNRNTTIVTFDEFVFFNNVTTLTGAGPADRGAFKGCTSL